MKTPLLYPHHGNQVALEHGSSMGSMGGWILPRFTLSPAGLRKSLTRAQMTGSLPLFQNWEACFGGPHSLYRIARVPCRPITMSLLWLSPAAIVLPSGGGVHPGRLS